MTGGGVKELRWFEEGRSPEPFPVRETVRVRKQVRIELTEEVCER